MHPRLCSGIQNNLSEEAINGTVPCVEDTGDVGTLHRNRGSYGYGKFSCGYCDAYCVYNAVEICFVVGVFANALVIARVFRDKKLRDPTFIGIAALALPDLLFLVHNLTISFETVIVRYTCQRPIIKSRPWYVLNSMIWFAANSHVAFLAVLRFLTIAYPIKSAIYLTPRRVILLSGAVWILGIILLGILAGLISLKIVLPGATGEFIIIWWITVYLIPLIVTTILHVLKLFRVKKASLTDSGTRHTRRSLNKMAKIVPLVIFMATVLPLPKLIYNCIRATGDDGNDIFPSKTFKLHFKGIANLVYLINHLINPFIYGFLSKKFRKSVKEMMPCLKMTCNGRGKTVNAKGTTIARVSSVGTISRNISSISSIESVDQHKTCHRICSFDSETSNRKCESVSSYESVDNSGNFKRF